MPEVAGRRQADAVRNPVDQHRDATMFTAPHPINAEQYLENHAAETNRILERNRRRLPRKPRGLRGEWKRRSGGNSTAR